MNEVWIVSDNKALPKLMEMAAHNNSKYEIKYITDIGKAVESIRGVCNRTTPKPKLIVTDIENTNHNSVQEMFRLANNAGIDTTPMQSLISKAFCVDINQHNFSDKKPANQVSM